LRDRHLQDLLWFGGTHDFPLRRGGLDSCLTDRQGGRASTLPLCLSRQPLSMFVSHVALMLDRPQQRKSLAVLSRWRFWVRIHRRTTR